MDNDAIGLVPAYDKSSGTGNGRLASLRDRDITLDSSIKALTEKINFYWSWENATDNHLRRYISLALDNFCDDFEKITETQKMIYACILERDFQDYILEGTRKYETHSSHGRNGDYTFRMSENLVGLAEETRKQFDLLTKDAKIIFAPFLDHLITFMDSDAFKNISEFNKLFIKEMKFTGYIAHQWDDIASEKLRNLNPNTYYSPDSEALRNALNSNIILHDTKCRIVTEGGEIPVESIAALSSTQRWQLATLNLCTAYDLCILADVQPTEYSRFLVGLLPDTDSPIKVDLIVKPVEGGFDLTFSFEESSADEELVKDSEQSKRPTFLCLIKRDASYGVINKRERRRSDAQKKIIGLKKSKYVKDHDWRSSKVYDMKTSYFYSSFFRPMQDVAKEFGNYLVELRYLAYIAREFSFWNLAARVVFPKALPKEENSTKLIKAKNPTLVFEDPAKVVPNDIIIDGKSRVQMITGPNQNGKSRYIDTVALSHIFFQAGWPVFAAEAEMSPKTDLRIHYVHSGVGIQGESRFSHECQRMHDVFSGMKGAYPLIIIDEPYTGTNHDDAKTLLEELLQACSKEDISIFLTTHFHALIPIVEEMENGKNLHCHVSEEGEFTFQIREGASTKTNALQVAQNAGVRFDQLVSVIKERKEYKQAVFSPGDHAYDDLPF